MHIWPPATPDASLDQLNRILFFTSFVRLQAHNLSRRMIILAEIIKEFCQDLESRTSSSDERHRRRFVRNRWIMKSQRQFSANCLTELSVRCNRWAATVALTEAALDQLFLQSDSQIDFIRLSCSWKRKWKFRQNQEFLSAWRRVTRAYLHCYH